MAIYNLTYVNEDQINYVANGYGAFSLASNGTSYVFTPDGEDTVFGTVEKSNNGNDGIYTLQNATFTKQGVNYLLNVNGSFVRSLNNVLPNVTGGTWTYEGTLPTVETLPTDIDLNSGFFETDLQTNITKYFAEAFKLKASDFEIVDGVVQINPDKLASITVDLTHIVNTSVETQNLTATNATLGTTTATDLTATTSSLGTATANSINASDITATNSTLGDAKADTIEVKNDGLIIEDADGHKHKFGFTTN